MRIVPFESRHADAWRTLNEAWIRRHFTLEAKDREALDDPDGAILARGGRIFIAEHEEQPVGCVAVIPMRDGGLEVAKMTVAQAARGRGVGRLLMQACIRAGREAGAPRLYLETNSRLAPALKLYRSAGFKELEPAEPSPYRRCDVWMELPL